MSNIVISQAKKLATTFGIEGDATEIVSVLKATAFRGEVSDAQMAALLVVASQYGLNPWTKEIYAFPDKTNGIVPVVGVDGWARIINDNPQFDGMEFRVSDTMVTMPDAKSAAPEWMEVLIYRKDRSRPTVVREYLDEVYREAFKGQYGPKIGPWQTHPKRFLRHKVTIQGARLAFGFGGIFDQDEAERIMESTKHMGPAEVVEPQKDVVVEPQNFPADRFAKNLPDWRKAIALGKAKPDGIIAKATTIGALSQAQQDAIRAPLTDAEKAAAVPKKAEPDVTDVEPKGEQAAPAEQAQTEGAPITRESLEQRLNAATTIDEVYALGEEVDKLAEPADRAAMNDLFDTRVQHFGG